ncbi:MAG: IS3 family transposase [Ruminococcus sp.]|nr:IS3 family transposase [Ruminococcus sp.]
MVILLESGKLVFSGKPIYFYNNQRIQLKTKLTPMEYRCQYAA